MDNTQFFKELFCAFRVVTDPFYERIVVIGEGEMDWPRRSPIAVEVFFTDLHRPVLDPIFNDLLPGRPNEPAGFTGHHVSNVTYHCKLCQIGISLVHSS